MKSSRVQEFKSLQDQGIKGSRVKNPLFAFTSHLHLRLCTLFAALFAATALYAGGDILEIRPCDEFGNSVTWPERTIANPYGSGEDLYFNIRLVSRENNTEVERLKGQYSKYEVKWNPMSGGSEAQDWIYNPLQVGIVVGGKTKYARLVNYRRTPNGDYLTQNLTDMVFTYHTDPGDFSLPIKLASDQYGTPVGENDSGMTVYIPPAIKMKWNVYYYYKDGSKTNDAVFAFNTNPTQGGTIDIDSPDDDVLNSNYSLKQCGFFVKTVDFKDANRPYDPGKYWMTVQEDSRNSVVGQLAAVATLTNATTLYVWSDNEEAVKLVGSNVETKKITVGYAGGAAVETNVQMAAVTIQGGQITGDFNISGITRDKTANLVLSNYKGYNWNVDGTGGTKIIDYVTVPVKCVEPPPPYITFDFVSGKTEGKPRNVPVPRGEDYKQSVAQFGLTLSTPWTGGDGKVKVTVAPVPTVAGLQTNKYIRISDKNNETTAWRNTGLVELTFNTQASEPILTQAVYAYALGGDKNTSTEEKCINFKVVKVEPAEAAAFYGTPQDDDYLMLTPQLPVVSAPTEGETFKFTGEVTYELDFTVSDNYYNVQDTNTGYTVYWKQRTSDKNYAVLSNANGQAALWRPDSDGVLREFVNGELTELKPAVTYLAPPDDDGKSYFYIIAPNGLVAPNGSKTAPRTVNVNYKEPAAPPTVWPIALNIDPDDPDCKEGTNVILKVRLSEVYSKKDPVYAFLQLADTNLYDKIDGTKNMAIKGARTGLKIEAGATVSSSSNFVLDDGAADGTEFSFDVVLCTSSTFSTNNVVKTFKSVNPLYVRAFNVIPSLNEVTINDEETGTPDANGDIWLTTPASIGAKTKFSFIVDDPSYHDLEAEGDEAFQLKYTLKGGGLNKTDQVVYGDPNTNTLEFTFVTKGDATLTLWTFDKDMDRKAATQKLVKRVVHFSVSDRPYVQVVTPDGELRGTYNEDATGSDYGALQVRFYRGAGDFTADDPIDVLLTVTNSTGKTTNTGMLKLGGTGLTDLGGGKYQLTMLAGLPSADIYISEADGQENSAFNIIAQVIDEKKTPEGVKWKDYFEDPAKKPQGAYTIRNAPPTLSVSLDMVTFDTVNTPASEENPLFRGVRGFQNTTTNAYTGVIGDNDPISFSVRDVVADFGSGASGATIEVTWTSEGRPLVTNVNADATSLSFVPKFNQGGSKYKVVTVTVKDKDAASGRGTTSASWYYEVQPSKQMTTLANGPASSESALSQKYAAADGIGQGHVYYDRDKISGATAFELTWNCGLSKVVNCYAWGYKATNRVDNGTLDGYMDIALDPSGKQAAAGATNFYTYPDTVRDSFLYCWLQKISQSSTTTSGGTETSSSSMASVIFGTLAPERPLAAATRAQVSLPTEEDKEGGYSPVMLEAIFSKEWLPADNMGDINADGIPDVYVSRYKFDVLDANGSVNSDADDLKRLDTYNEDEDYLPAIGSATFAHFIPSLSNTWVTEGRKFTALLEIRGWGTNLNDAVNKPFVKIANVQPDVNVVDASTTTFSPLEWDAYVQAGKPAGWSPERPTDPTMLDTDDDGLPDGYEYYIWYKATVGYMDNDVNDAFDVTQGVHKYLTGRRYNPVDPSNPTVITPATIAGKFDPLSPLSEDYDTMDTDWDGIPDSVEFMIGTNPLDYDTDGDGLPDGYEVAFSQTDPLKYASNDVICDANRNDDNDSMACYNQPMDVIGLLPRGTTGSAKAVEYYCSEESFSNEVAVVATNCWRLEVHYLDEKNKPATNVYFTTRAGFDDTEKNVYDVNGKKCLIGDLEKSNTWTGHKDKDDQLLRGAPVRLARGTLFNVVAKDEFHQQTVVTNPPKYYVAFPYNGGYARGRAVTGSLAGREVVAAFTNAVKILHYHVYQTHPYDPRTGWFHTQGSVETAPYTHMDELLSMTFWHNVGQIQEDQMIPTADRPMTTIWTEFTTSPIDADTDGDRMPDGWEFYLMAKTGEQGPKWKYSPLYQFQLLVTNEERDNDGDYLEWPQEYSGIRSSAQYGWSPTFPQWRNKTMPTDPWNKDTDGDGLQDGAEGGVGKADGASIVAANFMYNTYGKAGGGLNPLSWDTDADGLPDPWETEFHGTYKAGSTVTTTYEVFDDGSKSKTDAALATTTTVEQVIGIGATWNMDGMDGTVNDDRLDYDNDGLANWQEYMVGAMRCWRYDDTWSGWNSHSNSFEAGVMPANMDSDSNDDPWNRYWYERLLDKNNKSGNYNPNLANGYFDPGVYFSCCTNAFDGVKGAFYMFRDGVYHNLADEKSSPMAATAGKSYVPLQYICCDPTKHDTDYDGMDDYYELFHGMNPLLGEPDVVNHHPTNVDNPYDVVYDAYLRQRNSSLITGEGYSATANYWIWKFASERQLEIKHPETLGGYDFIRCPWLNGIAGADPDGDNIVNQEEAIMPQVQAYTTYHHCDPTPLWMTDSSYTNSLTRRFYKLTTPVGFEDTSSTNWAVASAKFVWDGTTYSLLDFPGFKLSADKTEVLFSYSANLWYVNSGWAYSFEENEGYDSDHDFLSDYEEAQGKTKNASNVLDHDDPLRRQAMWFGGESNPSFLQNPVSVSETVPVLAAATDSEEFFLYFTVECWAKPDAEIVSDANELHTLVARSVYADVSGPADEKLMRRNFLIGVKNGRWYACFDGTATDAKQTVEVANGPVASTEWTHVAATFDGKTLKLYVNGTCQGSKQDTSVQPEHGVNALAITEYGEIRPNGGTIYTGSSLISITVGAAPMESRGLVYDHAWLYRTPKGLAQQTTFKDYGAWYKGYIDEVRIWDGARSDNDIATDYANRTRYTTALAEENRRAVYNQWKLGARRADSAELQLPPQLMYHFAFDHLAGAVLTNDVITVPAGFNTAKTVTDAKARWVRPADWVESDWANSDVRSTVYSDNWYVPWVNNTVSHLPRFDTTTLDSVYWSEDYAGAVPASVALTNSAKKSFSFPRSNEVYSRWTQMTYSDEKYYDSHYDRDFSVYNDKGPQPNTKAWSQKTRFNAITDYNDLSKTNDPDTVSTDLLLQLRFTSRERNIVGDDLLPMGGAYPKRISSTDGGMWDNKPGEAPSAADAWAETGKDSDNNGLPDWWEEYARANYCKGLKPREPLEWGTTVLYYGRTMPAYMAYLRDLAKGLVKIGSTVEYAKVWDEKTGKWIYIYADTRDNDKDGLPDWWEEMFGLSTSVDNADDDPDNDGLSNYQEYLLSEVYPLDRNEGYGLVSEQKVDWNRANLWPTLAYSTTNQVVTDYYLAYGDTDKDIKNNAGKSVFFLNEYFGEMMTDHDFMEDWWENLYNISYTSAKKYDPFDDKDGDGWSTWAECRASLWGGYFSASLIDQWTGSSSEQYVPCYPQPIIGVRPTYYGEQDISGRQLVIRTTSGQTPRMDATFVVPQGVDAQTRYLGSFAGDALMHGQLSPGLLNGNAIVFERALTGSEKTYYWNYNWYDERQLAPAWGWVYGAWQHVSSGNSGSFEEYRKEYAVYPHIELEGADLTWEAFVESDMSADGTTADLYIGSVKFGFVDCTTGEYVLDMSKFSGEKPFDQYVFRVTYTSRLGEKWPQTIYVSDTKELQTGNTGVGTGDGYVREGKNTIEAFMDLDGDGAYTPGEPYGVVQNVDVGWHKIPVVTIELKDTSHVVPRFDVPENTDDRTVVLGSEASGSAFAANQNGNGGATGLSRTFVIRRKTINGMSEVTTAEGVVKAVPQRTLATKTLVLDSRAYLTEADVLGGGGKFDLDAKWLKLDCKKLDIDPATVMRAGYDIEESVTAADGSVSNVVVMSFENTFGVQRAKATVVSPLNAAPVYASSPTFAFSCADETMTAYRLQVRGADKNLVYDSEIQLLPGRVPNTAGNAVYEVTPPVYAGARVCSGAVTNAWFNDGAEYEWRVALYNAKYPDDNLTDASQSEKDVWSDGWAKFQMDVSNENRYPKIATGYGSLSLSVHYYGPTNVVLAGNDIYAEVFESGDFRGQPLARARVTLDETLSKRTGDAVSRTNAILRGIAPGKRFVRAFIDFNGNGQRDDWESWGYVNCVGKGVKAIYNPVAIDVTGSTVDSIVTEVAQHTLFIEDCDINQNDIPDCLEETVIPPVLDTDGDGIPDDEEANYSTDKGMRDTDGDAMRDGWEALFADTDPTIADADEVVNGDVMAFAYVDATFVTISNAQSSATRYMLGDGEKVPERGESVKGLSVWTTYDYPVSVGGVVTPVTGVGTNLTVSGRVTLVETGAKAVLVHNQVFEKFGFDATTATAAENAKNTKAFTALDKYLVIRYLDAQGKIKYPAGYDSGEDWVNRTGKWAEYSLKPFDADNDADGIPDGWELYIGANPWDFEDRNSDADNDGVRLIDEYDGGNSPTNPWNVDTDGDGVIDKYAFQYHLKGGDAGKDFDGDGLSNYAEYLITEVFKFAQLDPDNPKTNGSCVDYFRKVGELYFGEIFTDHDQVDDQWEQMYAHNVGASSDLYANRDVYDPSADYDNDGWSNWAEAKAGTNPEAVTSPGVGYVLPEYPIPTVAAKVVYSGKQSLTGALVFQAWSQVTDAGMTGVPDAEWISDSANTTNATRYVGINPGTVRSYYLGTGSVSPGTVCIRFRDMAYETATLIGETASDTNSVEAGSAYWYPVVLDNGYGELYTSVSNMTRTKVGTVDYATGMTVIDFGCDVLQGFAFDTIDDGTSGSATTKVNSHAYSNADRINLSRSYVLIEWTPVKITTTGNATYYLSAATGGKGFLREGLNKFVVFCDMPGGTAGKYDPGEPFGFVRGVDVGWQGGAFTVELTETSPVFARIDLGATDTTSAGELKASDRQVWQEGASTVMDISQDNETCNRLRKEMGVTCESGDGQIPNLENTRLIRIRVMRALVNGSNRLGVDEYGYDVPVKRVVLDKYLDLGTRSYLHEGDFLTGSAYDCDWDTFQADIVNRAAYVSKDTVGNPVFTDATNVTYAIVLGEGLIGTSNLVFRCVVNKVFDYAGSREAKNAAGTPAAAHVIRPVVDPTVPQDLVYGARPTFRFAMKDGYGRVYNSYTAFKIRIGSWTSDFLPLPPRDSNGWYEWTLDDPIGTKIEASGEYTWSVALYDTKYQSGEYRDQRCTEWSETSTFTVDMNNQQPMNDHGYSSIAASVKYVGPEEVLSMTKPGACAPVASRVVVQAFTTADFAGVPAGAAYVEDLDDVATPESVDANVWVKGLPQTGTYYLRAFIDSNGNGRKDDWESWGAAKEPVTISPATLVRPTVGIWIEDADTDGDWIPDAWEYAKKGNLTKLSAQIMNGGKIIFSGAVDSSGTAGISTGLSGASLTIFQNATFILDMLPDLIATGADVSINDIRAAVEKKVNPDTIKITALTLAPDGSKITLSVAAEVTDSIAGALLGQLYSTVDGAGLVGDTAKVTVKVFKKDSLAQAGWTEIIPHDPKTGEIVPLTANVGRGNDSVDVWLCDEDGTSYKDENGNPYMNMKSGFYRIEVVQ